MSLRHDDLTSYFLSFSTKSKCPEQRWFSLLFIAISIVFCMLSDAFIRSLPLFLSLLPPYQCQRIYSHCLAFLSNLMLSVRLTFDRTTPVIFQTVAGRRFQKLQTEWFWFFKRFTKNHYYALDKMALNPDCRLNRTGNFFHNRPSNHNSGKSGPTDNTTQITMKTKWERKLGSIEIETEDIVSS